jgi:hypothetical protein
MSQTTKIVAVGIAVLLVVAIGVVGYMATRSTEPIEVEQASEEYEEPEAEASEEEFEEEPEESTVTRVKVVYVEPEPVQEVASSEAPQPSGLTPEQQENRRIYEERMKTYDGTGPSPWVQGQIDWAREQGLLPSTSAPTSTCHQDRAACYGPGIQTEQEMEAEHAAQSRASNNGQGEGANMCGIAPDATLYGKPC